MYTLKGTSLKAFFVLKSLEVLRQFGQLIIK